MKELTINTSTMCFSALQWGRDTDPTVIALHGWLDNAGSFHKIAPQLNGIRVIAVDQAGHGFSDHRTSGADYSMALYVEDVLAVADALNLDRFSLLGHSMGAIVSTMTAAVVPERIEKLALIEGMWPMPGKAEDAPKQMARWLKFRQRRRNGASNKSIFKSRDDAAIVRMKGGTDPISREAVEILLQRALEAVDGGWRWRTDSRLMSPSAQRMVPEQAQSFIDNISAQTLLVLAEDSQMHRAAQKYESLLKGMSQHLFPGGHHLHLEESANTVASALNHFFESSAD